MVIFCGAFEKQARFFCRSERYFHSNFAHVDQLISQFIEWVILLHTTDITLNTIKTIYIPLSNDLNDESVNVNFFNNFLPPSRKLAQSPYDMSGNIWLSA